MGQRHASYVICESKYSHKEIHTIYNQWNFIKLQCIKLERVVNYFKRIKTPISNLFETFFSVHGTSPDAGWVGGHVEDSYYKDGTYTEPFQEDNNNGWNILKLTQDSEGIVSIELCCILGSEDLPYEDYPSKYLEPIETGTYFSHEREDVIKSDEYQAAVKTIVEGTKYNPKLKNEAVELINVQLLGIKQKKGKKSVHN